jgi:hypothetical protein
MKNTHHEVLRELVITSDPAHSEPRKAVATLIRRAIAACQDTLF